MKFNAHHQFIRTDPSDKQACHEVDLPQSASWLAKGGRGGGRVLRQNDIRQPIVCRYFEVIQKAVSRQKLSISQLKYSGCYRYACSFSKWPKRTTVFKNLIQQQGEEKQRNRSMLKEFQTKLRHERICHKGSTFREPDIRKSRKMMGKGAISATPLFCLHLGTRLTKLLEIITKNYLITKRNSQADCRMVSEARKQSMAWMETDYSKPTYFRWKIKWRLEHLGALGIMVEAAPLIITALVIQRKKH